MKKQPTKNGKMTLEKLAQMVQRGFEEVNGKFEFVATKKEIQAIRKEMDQRFQGVDNKIDALYLEVKEIKSVLPPLVRAMGHFEGEMLNFKQRLLRVEKKVGLSK